MGLENIAIRPCNASFKGVDLGYLDGEVQIKTDSKSKAVTTHQTGETEVTAIRTGVGAELTLTMKESSVARLKSIIDGGAGDSLNPAVAASKRIQDLTFTFLTTGTGGNSKTVAFVDDGTAGAETVTYVSPAVVIHMEAGVSTAQQIYDALVNTAAFTAAFDVEITGNETDAQVAVSPTNLADGAATGTEVIGYGTSKNFSAVTDDAGKLVLHPLSKGPTDYSEDVYAWLAYPIMGEVKFSGDAETMIPVTFKIYPDLTKDAKINMWGIGDHTQSLDA